MPKTLSIQSDNATGVMTTTRDERLATRDKLVAVRFYYYTEKKRFRLDDTMRILCEKEFFISDRSITNILAKDNTVSIMRQNPAKYKQFCREHKGFSWK